MKLAILCAVAATAIGADRPLTEGNAASNVRVFIYEDLQCPDCAVFRTMLDHDVLPRYGNRVAFEHRDFPLDKHKWARPGAIVSRYLATIRPELAVEYRRYMMSHQPAITPENFKDIVSAWARENGVDPAKVLAALDDRDLAAAVESDYREGIARGIAHTPTILIGDEAFIETFTLEEVTKSLDRALGTK